jgi:hypothetical protein
MIDTAIFTFGGVMEIRPISSISSQNHILFILSRLIDASERFKDNWESISDKKTFGSLLLW